MSIGDDILSLQNEKNRLQQTIIELQKEKEKLANNISPILSEIESMRTSYPQIHLGRCDDAGVLSYYNFITTQLTNCTKSLAECNTQLTLLIGRLSSLENDERGKCVLA